MADTLQDAGWVGSIAKGCSQLQKIPPSKHWAQEHRGIMDSIQGRRDLGLSQAPKGQNQADKRKECYYIDRKITK